MKHLTNTLLMKIQFINLKKGGVHYNSNDNYSIKDKVSTNEILIDYLKRIDISNIALTKNKLI